jgi:hypothetical protein
MMSVVNMLQSLVTAGQVILPASDYNRWNQVGSHTTRDTVETLSQLYQRQLQAAPLRNVLPTVNFGQHWLNQQTPRPASMRNSIAPPLDNSNEHISAPIIPPVPNQPNTRSISHRNQPHRRPPSIQEALQRHNIGNGGQAPLQVEHTPGVIQSHHISNVWENDWDMDWESDSGFSEPQLSHGRNGDVTISWTKTHFNDSWPETGDGE